MKKIYLTTILVLAFLSAFSQAGSNGVGVVIKASDTATLDLEKGWKFIEADSVIFARPDFDDSHWKTLKNTELQVDDSLDEHWFDGIGWFRLHLNVDSSMAGIPIGISLDQAGASEIYLDGKKIKTFGKINGPENSIYHNPKIAPFILVFDSAGPHVLAIRYANYKAKVNEKKWRAEMAGFTLTTGKSDDLIYAMALGISSVTFLTSLLGGIFSAIGLIHLCLFLYYRTNRSNLYFSLFSFCIAAIFLMVLMSSLSEDPSNELKLKAAMLPLVCTSCLTLSGFINALFFKRGRRVFYLNVVLFVAAIGCRLLQIDAAVIITLAMVVIVSLEVIITIIAAVFKKVKGALIIGSGLSSFALLILFILIASMMSGGNLDLGSNETFGKILGILIALAILSIPISISVYLAKTFAEVNQSLSAQLEQVNILSQKAIEHEQEKIRIISEQNILLEQKVEERTSDLLKEKKKSDDLLLNILPSEIAEELKLKGETEARHYDMVSVLFTDFVNFTGISSTLTPTELVKEIDICFKAFDAIIERNGLEKIKTIGDAYLAVCGIPEKDNDHAVKAIKAALDIRAYIAKHKEEGGKFEIRIGVHSGPVVAGIVGVKKFAYDIWGDTVNLASRMESNSEKGKINISGATYEIVKDTFRCTHRGKIDAKNKGLIDMYFVEE